MIDYPIGWEQAVDMLEANGRELERLRKVEAAATAYVSAYENLTRSPRATTKAHTRVREAYHVLRDSIGLTEAP